MRPLGIQRRQGAGGRFFRVEDSNPAIVYDGQWSSGNVTIGDDNDASIHTSTQPGSTIKFTFHGACFVLLPIPLRPMLPVDVFNHAEGSLCGT